MKRSLFVSIRMLLTPEHVQKLRPFFEQDLSETHVLTQKLLTEFRFGYNYGHIYFTQPNATDPNLPTSLRICGVPSGLWSGGLPKTYFSGQISGFGTPNYYPSDEHENVWQALDTSPLQLGKHSIRTGGNDGPNGGVLLPGS